MAESQSPSGFKGFFIFLGMLVVLVAAGIGLGIVLFGPPTQHAYDRSSPDAVLVAAKEMVLAGEAERLSELLYADSEGMREVFGRLGVMLGHLQDFALAINEQFPEEVAEIRAQAEEAARSGRGMSLLDQFRSNAGPRRGPPSDSQDDRINRILQAIAADPYAWLTNTEGRLSYVRIDDERVAVLWDGKPVLPPLGLVMREDQGQWSVVLPLNSLPMSSRFMPQTPDEFSIWVSLIQIADNVVLDLESDVREGRMHSLDALARHAGEKAVIPVGMGMIAYDRALRERREREREARARERAANQPETGGDG